MQLPGKNIKVRTYTNDFGVQVETYLNLCEPETVTHGTPVYHGVVEIIDGRGGVDVTIHIMPIVNEDENAPVHGHFYDNEEARAYITSRVKDIEEHVGRTDVPQDILIRNLYRMADEMEFIERSAMEDALGAIFGSDAPIDVELDDAPPALGELLQ